MSPHTPAISAHLDASELVAAIREPDMHSGPHAHSALAFSARLQADDWPVRLFRTPTAAWPRLSAPLLLYLADELPAPPQECQVAPTGQGPGWRRAIGCRRA